MWVWLDVDRSTNDGVQLKFGWIAPNVNRMGQSIPRFFLITSQFFYQVNNITMIADQVLCYILNRWYHVIIKEVGKKTVTLSRSTELPFSQKSEAACV